MYDNNNKRSNGGSGDRDVGGSIMIGNSARGGDYSPKSTTTKAISSFIGSGGGGGTEDAPFVFDSSDDDDDDDDDGNVRDGGGGPLSSSSIVSESNKGSPTNTNTTNTSSSLVVGKWPRMVPRVLVTDNGGKGLEKIGGEKKDVNWQDIDKNTKHVSFHQPIIDENIKVHFYDDECKTLINRKKDSGRFVTKYLGGNLLVDNKLVSTLHEVIKQKSTGVFDICPKKHRGEILLVVGKTMKLFNHVQNQTNYFDKNLAEARELFQVLGIVNKVNCFHLNNDTGAFLKLLKFCINGEYDEARQWLQTIQFAHSK